MPTSRRKFRVLSIVDEFTRECLALRADVSQPSTKVVAAWEEIASCRGAPQGLIIDHGPELVAKTLDALAYARGVELSFTRPAKLVDNCFVESFQDKFRDECRTRLSEQPPHQLHLALPLLRHHDDHHARFDGGHHLVVSRGARSCDG